MFGIKYGLRGRVMVLGLLVLLLEGIALVIFSQMATLFLAIGAMLIFSLFVQMSEGATFSVVPFINRAITPAMFGLAACVRGIGICRLRMLALGARDLNDSQFGH